MSTTENNTHHQSAPTSDSSLEKSDVVIERLDVLDSPDNNNVTSATSSLKNERVASGLLKMLGDESILDGLEDLPPSDTLLDDDPESYDTEEQGSGFQPAKRTVSDASGSGDGSFLHSHSDISDNDDHSPLQFHNERQFELEFKLHEAEQKVEQLNLQLKGKSMQLEQVQVALISYEEEIMQLRQHISNGSGTSGSEEDDEQVKKQKPPPLSGPPPVTPVGSVSLETAEQLSSKIIKLQQRVEELEDIMVYTKLDNAQLKETTEFLKSKLRQYTKKTTATEKKAASSAKSPSVRNLFSRK